MEIELIWKGDFPINMETPKGEEGKHGIYAFIYNKKEIIYIGKALGKMHLYQESKYRYKPLGRALIDLGVLRGDFKRNEIEIVERDYCRKYVAELNYYNNEDEKKKKLECAEKLLIFVKQPRGNNQSKKRYDGIIPIKLINKGPIVGKLLLNYYEIRSKI